MQHFKTICRNVLVGSLGVGLLGIGLLPPVADAQLPPGMKPSETTK